MKGWTRRARRLPADAAAAVIAVLVCVYVIGGPLWVARYPLMVDLPQHAANASVLRHYFDPAWHFREQLTIAPFAVPYMLFYAVAAAFMFVLPTLQAVKAAVFVMLALLPAGLATLFWGMRKSPLLGASGVVFCWGTLASWGFLNFVGALGLWAMVVGIGLRAAERSERQAAWMVGPLLVVLFFAHPFRFPMAVVSLALVAWLRYRKGLRHRALLPVVASAVVLGVVWWVMRPSDVVVDLGGAGLYWERLKVEGLGEHPYKSLRSGLDAQTFRRAMAMVGLLGALLTFDVWRRGKPQRQRRRFIVALLVVAGSALLATVGYLTLPLQMGTWWFIYPRELTAALFMALALLPDLPRKPLWRLGAVVWLSAAVVPLGAVAVDSQRAFDRSTQHFAKISAELPRAPKLMYLVFDHSGSPLLQSPYRHLPAYIQAEKGGWTSFSFAWLGHSPLRFRSPEQPGAVVPPRPPLRWEWTPHRFNLERHGAFYDWFLVRSPRAPDHLFPDIERVAQHGNWWLYHRRKL